MARVGIDNKKRSGHGVVMSNSEPLLTAAEFARRANVHAETVRRWTREGLLNAVELPNGRKRYDAAQLAVIAPSAPEDVAS